MEKQPLYSPWRFEEVEAPGFQDNLHMDLVRVVSATQRPPLLPKKYFWYSFFFSCHTHFHSGTTFLNQRWSPPLRLQASHCSTFRIMCDVSSTAVFCSESIECFRGMASKFFFKCMIIIIIIIIIFIIIIIIIIICALWSRDMNIYSSLSACTFTLASQFSFDNPFLVFLNAVCVFASFICHILKVLFITLCPLIFACWKSCLESKNCSPLSQKYVTEALKYSIILSQMMDNVSSLGRPEPAFVRWVLL